MPHVLSQDLRNAVLQAAIQGKLTKQLSTDSNAFENYESIKESHNRISPCKSELDYGSMGFDIPSNWVMAELNELFDFVDYRGKTPSKIKEGVFLITASNIRKGYMDYTRKEYISENEYLNRQSRGVTEYGDLLFTTEAPMGMAALCDLKKTSCGQRVITFKEYIKGRLIPKLYMLFILSPAFQHQLLDNCTGTTAKGIKADKLKHFLIPLPPIEEQSRIVAKVDELMAKIDEYEKIEKELTELQKAFPRNMKDAILQAAMQGKLTEQLESDGTSHLRYSTDVSDEDIPFDIPEEWTWTTLAKLVKRDEIGDGDWVLSNDMCSQSNNNLIQIGSVGNGEYVNKDFRYVSDDFFEAKNCSELYKNDILVSRFISKGHMNVCIIPELPGRLFTAVDVCWIRNNPDRYINTWLMWCLLSQGVQKQVMSYTAGTTRQRISKTNLMKVYLPLPPIEEQQRIVDKLDQLLPLCEQLEKMAA